MQPKRASVWYAAAIAISSMVAAAGVEGATIAGICSDGSTSLPSCTCKSPSGFSIALLPTSTTGVFKYSISGSGNAKVNSIRDVQIIVPRPVTPTQAGTGILIGSGGDVTSFLNYCQADPNSGNNKGNCLGFLVHALPHGATNTAGSLDIAVGQNVAAGMVSFNIIGGNGNTELCSAVDQNGVVIVPPGLPAGIAGPGDIGDPFQPKFAEQQATVAGGKCSAHLIFDKKGNVIDVTVDPSTPTCVVGSPGDPTSQFPTTDIVIGGVPLKNNTGPHGITFGTGTTTCYGPGIPSPARCICTALPCP